MKKRIALVVNSLSGGGAERTVANLSKALSDKYTVDIVVNDKEHLEYPYKGNIVSLNMPPMSARMNASYQVRGILKRTAVLRRLKKKRKYTAVLSFSEMTNVANVLSGNHYGKTIISIRNSVLKGKDSSWMHRITTSTLLPWCCRSADKIVCCSKGIAEELQSLYGLKAEKTAVIYNGLELSAIHKKSLEEISEKESERWAGKKLIVTVGRLTRQKGQRHLLKSVKYLSDQGLNVHLLILGEGELKESLIEEIRKMGISDNVTMLGFVRNPYKYMRQADVFAAPSLYEGFSNVMIEALACGRPVLSSDHETGAREILAPATDYTSRVKDRIDEAAYGILVPVCEEKKTGNFDLLSKEEVLMADGLKRILTDPACAAKYHRLAMERAGQLDIKQVCEQWIQVIEE